MKNLLRPTPILGLTIQKQATIYICIAFSREHIDGVRLIGMGVYRDLHAWGHL